MAKRAAKYATRTEKAIKDALVKLLAEKPLAGITISELAREAGISRSTFYEHFGNTADVYDALIADISGDMSSFMSQVACQDGFEPSGRPFCAFMREAGEFAPAVREPRFMDSFLLRQGAYETHDLYSVLTDAGYTDAQARAVCSFQLSGCFSAARQTGSDDEWSDIRPVIDRFILGGIAACLAAKRP